MDNLTINEVEVILRYAKRYLEMRQEQAANPNNKTLTEIKENIELVDNKIQTIKRRAGLNKTKRR